MYSVDFLNLVTQVLVLLGIFLCYLCDNFPFQYVFFSVLSGIPVNQMLELLDWSSTTFSIISISLCHFLGEYLDYFSTFLVIFLGGQGGN